MTPAADVFTRSSYEGSAGMIAGGMEVFSSDESKTLNLPTEEQLVLLRKQKCNDSQFYVFISGLIRFHFLMFVLAACFRIDQDHIQEIQQYAFDAGEIVGLSLMRILNSKIDRDDNMM